jgi:hypothetical protein
MTIFRRDRTSREKRPLNSSNLSPSVLPHISNRLIPAGLRILKSEKKMCWVLRIRTEEVHIVDSDTQHDKRKTTHCYLSTVMFSFIPCWERRVFHNNAQREPLLHFYWNMFSDIRILYRGGNSTGYTNWLNCYLVGTLCILLRNTAPSVK